MLYTLRYSWMNAVEKKINHYHKPLYSCQHKLSLKIRWPFYCPQKNQNRSVRTFIISTNIATRKNKKNLTMVISRSGFRYLLSRSFEPHLTEKEMIQSNPALSRSYSKLRSCIFQC